MDFTTKMGDIDFHEDHHDERRHRAPFHETRLHPERHQAHHDKVSRKHPERKTMKPKAGHKWAKSKTHKGDKDFTTKKGDKDFHRGGHDEKHKEGHKRKARPYRKRK